MRRLKILQLTTQSDGSRRLSVCDPDDALTLPLTAYAPAEPWNADWKAGDTVEVDAREKTSGSGNRYLTLYPTAALANDEPRTISDGDAIRIMSLSLHAKLDQMSTKLDALVSQQEVDGIKF